MQRVRIIVCSLVGSLGCLATVLGLIAEANRIGASQVEVVGGQCFYSRRTTPALGAGLSAALSLLVSQLLASTSGGCVCYCANRRNNGFINHNPAMARKRTVAIVCLTISWVVFVNSFALLIEGALLNAPQLYQQQSGRLKDCYIVKPGVFASGATLALLASVLAIAYYLAATSDSSPTIVAALAAGHSSALVPAPLDMEAAVVYPVHMRLIKPQI